MDTLADFGKIAEFLKHPLVLMGFVLMMVFSIHKLVLNVGILPKLNQKQGGLVVTLLLRYGFWLGVLIVLSGFGLQFYQAYAETAVKNSTKTAENTANIKQIVTTLISKHQLDTQTKDEQIKELTKAFTDLSTGQGIIASQSERNAALAASAQGNTTLAKVLFIKATQDGEQEAKQTAQAYRNLGALTYLDNTQEALQAYRRATQLDPNNTDGWNRLGHLLHRVGELDEATAVYNKVSTIGKAHYSQKEMVATYGNLDGTIGFHKKALSITGTTTDNTYYVSPTGVDTNNGKSRSTPVKTIKAALNKSTISGDIVYVMTGTYVEIVTIGQSGITLSAYPNNKPIIDGTGTLPSVNFGSLINMALPDFAG